MIWYSNRSNWPVFGRPDPDPRDNITRQFDAHQQQQLYYEHQYSQHMQHRVVCVCVCRYTSPLYTIRGEENKTCTEEKRAILRVFFLLSYISSCLRAHCGCLCVCLCLYVCVCVFLVCCVSFRGLFRELLAASALLPCFGFVSNSGGGFVVIAWVSFRCCWSLLCCWFLSFAFGEVKKACGAVCGP